ncbi:MAG: YifB family Mg chelatase-like AAA ATPase [Chloroflexi bacterium]|nr:YifB family Mg chelatase-like AAA ATPase [Chloroflexota bacterium]
MLAKIYSCTVTDLEGDIIDVEVDAASQGLPATIIVGLPDTAVQESRERVRSAIKNVGLEYPRKKVTINLAPADLRKEGPFFDLPIAVGILAAGDQIPQDQLENSLFIGELSLDGSTRHVRGILPITAKAKSSGFEQIFVPTCDAQEAALIPGIRVIPVASLDALYRHLRQEEITPPTEPLAIEAEVPSFATDFADIRGQEHVKRALEIAAAGAHNLLMIGPPGTGKTLMARALPSILPSMSIEEALDVTRIYSIADMLPADQPLIQTRPFRSPHHTISNVGLVGGGNHPRPGEISMAHRGVLFLDEFPEFGQRVLEVLRQPLEDKVVTISRASGSVSFPANFMLVAAMNPCPCGFYGDPVRACTCSEMSVTRYRKRISGPLLDRIDIHIEVPRIEYQKLAGNEQLETSAQIRERVERARAVQRRRFAAHPHTVSNADMKPSEIRKACPLDADGEKLMKMATERYKLSARAFHRLLKLARTIADLAESEKIESAHLAEAIQYRTRLD